MCGADLAATDDENSRVAYELANRLHVQWSSYTLTTAFCCILGIFSSLGVLCFGALELDGAARVGLLSARECVLIARENAHNGVDT